MYHHTASDAWVLTRFDDVQRAARDWETFSSASGVVLGQEKLWGEGSFLDHDPPIHKSLRAVARHAFAPRAIAELASVVQAETDQILIGWRERETVDLADELAWAVPVAIAMSLLGIHEAERPAVQRSLRRLTGDLPGDERAEEAVRLAEAEELRSLLRELAERRHAAPRDDLISAIVHAEVDGERLTLDHAAGMGGLLLTAATDSVASLISTSILELASRPADRGAVIDPSTRRAAIEELIRFISPVQQVRRIATRAFELHDRCIPEGSNVVLSFAAANRDPRRFKLPDLLDFDREEKRNIAFGEGIHHCLGAPLARLEAPIVLASFFERFPGYRIAAPFSRAPVSLAPLYYEAPLILYNNS